MKPRIYLDFNATMPLVPAARAAIAAAFDAAGNPSSIHADGRRARDLVERSRNQVAALVGVPREQLVFTSGGTEANALGIRVLMAEARRRGLPAIATTTRIEHPSLRGAIATCGDAGWQVRWLAVAEDAAIIETSSDLVGIVAISAVNHELGTIASTASGGIEAVVAWARARGALVHIDAVQAAGKLELAPITRLADSVAISAHKIGGPQGAGALVLAAGVDHAGTNDLPDAAIEPVAGHQERGRRAGTENTLGIVGFGAAAACVDVAHWSRVTALGERFEAGLRALGGVRIHGAQNARVGGTINAGFEGALGESIVIALDLAGISVSTGAACTSGSVQPSPVLLGLGMSAGQARQAVRFSLGPTTTSSEIDEVLAILPGIVDTARRHGS
ncbi:MAG: cysteine desulfurase family protein [Kofleriaceae bacterium]